MRYLMAVGLMLICSQVQAQNVMEFTPSVFLMQIVDGQGAGVDILFNGESSYDLTVLQATASPGDSWSARDLDTNTIVATVTYQGNGQWSGDGSGPGFGGGGGPPGGGGGWPAAIPELFPASDGLAAVEGVWVYAAGAFILFGVGVATLGWWL